MSPEQLVSEGFMTVAEAASFLRVSRSSLYALMERGELCYSKFGRTRRIPRKALVAMAAAAMRGSVGE